MTYTSEHSIHSEEFYSDRYQRVIAIPMSELHPNPFNGSIEDITVCFGGEPKFRLTPIDPKEDLVFFREEVLSDD